MQLHGRERQVFMTIKVTQNQGFNMPGEADSSLELGRTDLVMNVHDC